jgi:hypothetical protein
MSSLFAQCISSRGELRAYETAVFMMDKLNRDRTLPVESDERRNAMVRMGRVMASAGYEPAFIAGMLGNVQHEGNVGQFERDWGGTAQAYLRLIPNYGAEYCNQNITSKNLVTVRNLLLNLQGLNWNNGKFGLGCIQWTGERTLHLVNTYLEVTGGNDFITLIQATLAEGLMIIRELGEAPKPGIANYRRIHSGWRAANSSNINSADAAYDAGHRLCMSYLIPTDTSAKAIQRGNAARTIFRIMMS